MKKKSKIDYVLILFLLFIVIILLDLILNLYTNSNIVISNIFPDLNATDGWEQRGQWGDMLSGHFAALAFLAVAYSIYMQQKESKIEKSLNSFKMILELVKNTKDESIYLTSKTNESLIEILTKTLDFIKEKNSLEIVEI
ncbi:MAG: hypothetical protein Q8O20_05410 [Sulfuricurvum sp.]|uniref:hypothetical protein n=1 Tax=Sulfuricurvum sp. TaxID=2025608 RepID=UPI0027346001|nr:hypothetical protein [Sulfuricurvum sp.]MDP2850494.1 hypothetical protein [Sulfuricurvum sp.]